MRQRPVAAAFDIIETVFSLERLRERLTAAGLPGGSLETWFAQTLRDAFALEVTGVYKPFREIASATLASLFAGHGTPPEPARLPQVLDGFAELAPHPDAGSAFRRLHEAGIRIVSLTNGGAAVTEKLLQSAGLRQLVERTITVDEVAHWKPHADVYLHAAKCVGADPARLALVAAHPWDIHGAGRAGLTTAYVARGKPFPATMMPPHVTGASLAEVADALASLS